MWVTMTAHDPASISFNFGEHQFTLAETARVSGVSEKTMRSWMDRGLFDGGKKHFAGRWLFSGYDAIRLTVMGALTNFSVDPSTAAPIAQTALDRCIALMNPRPEGARAVKLDPPKNPYFEEPAYYPYEVFLVAIADGKPHVWDADIDDLNALYRTSATELERTDPDQVLLRRPHLVIPIDTIMFDLATNLSNILSNERG